MVKVGKVLLDHDSVQYVQVNNVYVYPQPVFKNAKERMAYNRLVYNIKKVLPIAKEVRKIIIETGDYLETLPNKKAKDAHMKLVEKEQPFAEPKLFNLVFGHKGGMQATPEMLSAFRSFVPQDALWGVTHFGRDNWTFLAAAIAMGATVVRIGFEDSAYLEEGKSAEYNYQLVEKIVALIRAMGLGCRNTAGSTRNLAFKKEVSVC